MAEEKPITKSALLAVLKEAGFATKTDLRKIVMEETAEEIARYHDGQMQPDLQKISQAIQSLRELIKDGFQGIKSRIRFLKDDVGGIKGELAGIPSRKKFHELSERVKRLEGFPPHN